MKNIIAILLLSLLLMGPSIAPAQEAETAAPVLKPENTEVQATEVPATDDQAIPASPAEAAPVPDLEAASENGEMHKKSTSDLINEIEDLVEKAASGKVADTEKVAIKLRIRSLRDRADRDQANAPWESKSLDSVGGLLIAGVTIILIFGTPIMLVAAVLYAGYRKHRLMHNTIDQYVSSGRDIPPEVLQSLHREVVPTNNLHRGLLMAGIGLGVIACFLIMDAAETAALGLIPLFIGLAQLLIWKLEKK